VSQHPKKVLIISYYFPPSGGPGVQRPLKFTRSLLTTGWQPIVLTVKEDAEFSVRDTSLMEWIPPQVPVVRTGLFEPYQFYRKFTRKSADDFLDSAALSESEKNEKSLKEKMALFIRSWLFIPDARVGWLLPATMAAFKIIRKERPQILLTSAPPNTTHLIGLLLKKITGIRWIADFRDPWFKYLVPQRSYRLPQKLDALMGKAVMKNADHVVAVCQGVKKELMASFGQSISEKIKIITNGFDQAYFDAIKDVGSEERFQLAYVGSIYHRYDFRPFLRALEAFCHENPGVRKFLSLTIVGSMDRIAREWFEQSSCSKFVHILGYKKYFEALRIMKESSVLLLYIMDDERGKNIPTSKLYEYIGAQRPILALSPPDSDAANIIRDVRAGEIVRPDDIDGIKTALEKLYNQWRAGKKLSLENNPARLKYEMKALTDQLVDVFMNRNRRYN